MNTPAYLNRFLPLLAVIFPLALASCQHEPFEEPSDLIGHEAYNQFTMSSYDYDAEMSLTKAGEPASNVIEEDGYSFTLTVTPRSMETRSSFDDVTWDKADSKVGIYVVEHVDDAQIGTMDTEHLNVVSESANLTREGNTISSSSVDILENIRSYDPSNSHYNNSVDICAYFPYAEEITDAVSLTNTSNSIVGIFNAKDASNVLHLPFTMKPTQTDDNIWFHDLMISIREGVVTGKNTYGNVGKKNRSTYDGSGNIDKYYDLTETLRDDRPGEITCDNVHLRMRHIFSRFNITIMHDSRFDGAIIDRIYVDGAKVFSYGQINLLTGIVTPGGNSRIDRLISDNVLNGEFNMTMMLCPCTIKAEGDMVFHILIDNVEYKCDLYKIMKDVEIKDSYIYDLTLSFSKNSTLVVNNGYGGTAAAVEYNPGQYDAYGTYGERCTITSGTSDKPYEKIGTMAQWLVVAPKTGWAFKGIFVNGEQIYFNGGTDPLTKPSSGYRIREFLSAEGTTGKHYYCKLDEINEKNTRYDVVYVPETSNWYSQPGHIIQQFDGIYNNGFSSIIKTDALGVEYDAVPPTDPSVTIWKDLSGNGNDAQLANIDIHAELQPWRSNLYDQKTLGNNKTYLDYQTTQQSGWVNGGLKLDGVNDYVTFPAILPSRDSDRDTQDMNLTIEMYLCMECPQPGRFPRILCEAEPGLMENDVSLNTYTAHGYPTLLFTSTSNSASSTNVIYYPASSTATSIYFMGLGHNNGYSNDGKLAYSPSGNRILHVVFWYRGGFGDVTDMSIFNDTHKWNQVKKQLGMGDPRNCLITLVEYWDVATNSMVRHTLSFYGDDPEDNANGTSMFNGLRGSVEYKKLIETVFNNGIETTAAEFEALRTANIEFDRMLTHPLSKSIHIQNNDSYLEDPFIPSERWACIGGRQNDYSRQLNATVFSYIMYDTLLTIEEVEYNRQLHFDRFGAYKTDLR